MPHRRRCPASAPLLLVVLFIIVVESSLCEGAPTTHDQRQEGGLNVRLDLENFVIFIARPSSASNNNLDAFDTIAQLLTDTSRYRLAPVNEQRNENHENPKFDEAEEGSSDEDKSREEVVVIVQPDDNNKVARDVRKSNGGAFVEKQSKGKYKFVEAVEEPQSLKLVGDSLENCGPGRSRDRLGICQIDSTPAEAQR